MEAGDKQFERVIFVRIFVTLAKSVQQGDIYNIWPRNC